MQASQTAVNSTGVLLLKGKIRLESIWPNKKRSSEFGEFCSEFVQYQLVLVNTYKLNRSIFSINWELIWTEISSIVGYSFVFGGLHNVMTSSLRESL